MGEPVIRLYEALILLNQRAVAEDFSGCVDHVRELFSRADAELVVLRRWDERKLAYEIKGQKRGTFLLAYFRAAARQIVNIERDCNLSEQVLRVLIIQAEHVGATELELAGRDADLSLEAKIRRGLDEPSPAPDTSPQTVQTTAQSPDTGSTGVADKGPDAAHPIASEQSE